MPKYPRGWGEAVCKNHRDTLDHPRRDDTESDDTKRDETGRDDARRGDTRGSDVKGRYIEGMVPTTGRQFKMGKRSAPRKGEKKKYEKIFSFFGGMAGTSVAPVHSSARSGPAFIFVHSLRVF